MSNHLPEKKPIWPRLIIYPLILALVILVAVDPIGQHHLNERARKAQAKATAVALVSALQGYYVEYDKWPDFTGDGRFLDEKRQAQLLRMLSGQNENNNPRKIVFYEDRTAKKGSDLKHQYRGGFSPETGALFDPWGSLYQIAIHSDSGEHIANPYPDDYPPIENGIIVWSLGKDGQQGAPTNARTLKGSDDVTSWQ